MWLEAVPETYITDIKIIPDLDKSRFDVKVTSSEAGKCPVRVNIKARDVVVATAVGRPLGIFRCMCPFPVSGHLPILICMMWR